MRDKRFLPYEPDKALALPLDMRTCLPEDHLDYFISDVVDELDLTEIVDKYQPESPITIGSGLSVRRHPSRWLMTIGQRSCE